MTVLSHDTMLSAKCGITSLELLAFIYLDVGYPGISIHVSLALQMLALTQLTQACTCIQPDAILWQGSDSVKLATAAHNYPIGCSMQEATVS